MLAHLAAVSTVPATLTVGDTRFPAGLEQAAYFLCSEGLANVAKHAGASTVSIRVSGADGLIVTVVDDGAGGADPMRGTGLRGLIDRIEAVGGTCRSRARRARERGSRLESH